VKHIFDFGFLIVDCGAIKIAFKSFLLGTPRRRPEIKDAATRSPSN